MAAPKASLARALPEEVKLRVRKLLSQLQESRSEAFRGDFGCSVGGIESQNGLKRL